MRTRWRQSIDKQSIEFGVNAEECSFMSDQDAYDLLEATKEHYRKGIGTTARVIIILMNLDVIERTHDMSEALHAFNHRRCNE